MTVTPAALRSRGRGFTLLELIFVVIIMGVLLGVSAPNLRDSFNKLQLESVSRELQDLMNYCQHLSIVEGRVVYFGLDQEKQACRVFQKKPPGEVKSYSLPAGFRFESDRTEVLFYPDGSIDDVTLYVIGRHGQTITLTTKGIFGGVKRES